MIVSLCLTLAASAGEVPYAAKGHAYNPVFSTDGRAIAFEVNPHQGSVDLYLAALAGTEPSTGAIRIALPGTDSPFGGGGHVAASPAWHPDGIVVFEASNPGRKVRLYYQQGVRGSASELVTGEELAGNLTSVALSPDGRRMAFVSDAAMGTSLVLRDSQTRKLDRLTTSEQPQSNPSFSSDGSRIVFSRRGPEGEDIWEVDLASRAERKLASGLGDQTRPVYGADDVVLYFDGSRGDEHWDLMSVKAKRTRTLARDIRLPLRARPPVTPDGRHVAFTWADPTKSSRVMIARVDGSRTVAHTTPFTAVGEPALAQQGPRTLLAYTALPSKGSEWRFLYVADVSDKVAAKARTP